MPEPASVPLQHTVKVALVSVGGRVLAQLTGGTTWSKHSGDPNALEQQVKRIGHQHVGVNSSPAPKRSPRAAGSSKK
jgi:hypothetical protein